MEQAAKLQREAARLAPDSPRHLDALAGYEALLSDGCRASIHVDAVTSAPERRHPIDLPICDRWPDLRARIGGLDWPEIDSRLSGHGVAHIPSLLEATECEVIRFVVR